MTDGLTASQRALLHAMVVGKRQLFYAPHRGPHGEPGGYWYVSITGPKRVTYQTVQALLDYELIEYFCGQNMYAGGRHRSGYSPAVIEPTDKAIEVFEPFALKLSAHSQEQSP